MIWTACQVYCIATLSYCLRWSDQPLQARSLDADSRLIHRNDDRLNLTIRNPDSPATGDSPTLSTSEMGLVSTTVERAVRGEHKLITGRARTGNFIVQVQLP